MNDNKTLSFMPTQTDAPQRLWSIVRGCILVAVPLGLFAWFMVQVLRAVLFPFGIDYGPRPPDPPRDFLRITGWEFPADAEVLFAEDTYSGSFRGGGDYTLIIQTSPEIVNGWVSSAGVHTWETCPVPTEIVRGTWNKLPQHEGTLYRAKPYYDDDDDWESGTVLIVNPDIGKVWVYTWAH